MEISHELDVGHETQGKQVSYFGSEQLGEY